MANLNDTPSAGTLTAADFKPLPAGCGSNRWPERRVNWPDTVPVQAAEACTEIGHDDDPYDGTAVIRGLISAAGITAILAAVVVALI